jgi:hypothetical protein
MFSEKQKQNRMSLFFIHHTDRYFNASTLASHGSKWGPSVVLHEQWWCIVGLYKNGNVPDSVIFMNFVFPTDVEILAPCRHVGEFIRIEEAYWVHLCFYPKRPGYFLETIHHITCCFTQEEHNKREVSDLTKVTLFLVNSLHFFFICH